MRTTVLCQILGNFVTLTAELHKNHVSMAAAVAYCNVVKTAPVTHLATKAPAPRTCTTHLLRLLFQCLLLQRSYGGFLLQILDHLLHISDVLTRSVSSWMHEVLQN